IGFILTGGYHVLLMIFNQIGYPKLQTILIFLVFISNVIFNLIFIPFLGIYGAAIGTSLSFLVQMFFIKYFLKVKFDVIIK
ncbi:MAG: polysaccharide biosynthesis C-terminal domain-containing protein, partial [Bacteroidia bacterium]|nr:polysaccharide biosynthesis C-terminal domain-containing protein [Bacteroidia bacterium]